jgi:protein arginine kinase
MTYEQFTGEALSEWMKGKGPDSDVVISSRVRLARNLQEFPYPMLATPIQAEEILVTVSKILKDPQFQKISHFSWISLSQLTELEKMILVEKHLISPNLANDSKHGGVILNDHQSISIMVNEEDHIRIQCLSDGFQLQETWDQANQIDDIFESQLNYGYDEKRGYLTCCPTNVGTGIRASVMMHLPALVLTKQINRILSAASQVGLTVRGLYGEGSEALGNLFQVSNQVTLGQTEQEIIDNLHSVTLQIIEHERSARKKLLQDSPMRIIDRVNRSLGILTYAGIIDSKEAAQRLSDVRLGIDLDIINHGSAQIMNELLVMTQPGFLQQMSGEKLSAENRDVRRAQLIREKITSMKKKKN